MQAKLLTAILLVICCVASAHAEDATTGYVDVASQHCASWIGHGAADLTFALGKAKAKFSDSELQHFSQFFGDDLMKHYGVAEGAECKLTEAAAKPLVDDSNAPINSRKKDAVVPEQAVVSGVLAGANGAPVAVAYRMEQAEAGQPWVIQSISLNGEPIVDRYREAFETAAAQGGADAVLQQLQQQ